jgi:outer membrane protein TolC
MVGRPKGLPLALILFAVLTACAVGPDYRPAPAAAVTARNLEAGHFAAASPPADWWQKFPDPLLGRLDDRTLAANLDVAIAVEHVRAARAAFAEAKLDYAPHVPLEAQYARSEEQFPGFSTDRINIASYTTGFDASWELDLFGRVTVTGFVGFLTGDGAQPGAATSRAWAVSPTLTWPALDFGSAHARLRAAKAESAGALDEYQKAVLGALEDFENACFNYSRQIERLSNVVEQADASQRAAKMAEIQYREGQINFLVLLDAQRTELSAEDDVAQAETAVNTGAVAVYKALGGVPAAAPQTQTVAATGR